MATARVPACPHCGHVLAGLSLPAGDGQRTYCTACGLLALTDSAALEGLRRPTRAERNAAYSNPREMALRAAWLRANGPALRRSNRARRAQAGSAKWEWLLLLAVAAVVIGVPLVTYLAR